MAKSPHEKIEELVKLCATLEERVDNARRSVDLLGNIPERVGVLESQMADVRTSRHDWTNRVWNFFFSVLGIVIGAGILILLGWKKAG